ncbi:MAG TPA: PAS domain-containing protein [Terracidiphilus sp.]
MSAPSPFFQLVHAAAEMTWVIPVRGDRVAENSAWLQYTGQTRQEASDRGWILAIHPDDRNRTLRAWDEAMAEGRTGKINHRVRRFDGAYRLMQGCAIPVKDEQGAIVEWFGMHIDLDEPEIPEPRSIEGDDRFAKIFDSDLIGIGVLGLSGSFLDGNEALLRLLGYTHEDLVAGRVRWDEMTPAEFKPADTVRIAEALERGSCLPYEKELIRKDGGRVPVLVGFTLLTLPGNPDPKFIGFVLEFSQQKLLQRELAERERSFRELAESLPQLVWTADGRGTKTFCNEQYFRYSGYSSLDQMNTSWLDLIHPDDRPKARTAWEVSTRTGELYQCEYRMRRRDGMYRWHLARGTPIRDSSGKITQWMGSSTDIHEQRLVEEAMRRSEKLAVAGRLAANIAHEINNPLMSMTNALFLAMQDGALSETTRTYLKLVDQELARIGQVTRQTLIFHHQSSQPASANVCQIMDSILSVFSPRMKDRSVILKRKYQECGNLFCYGEDVRQAFASILGNAMDAVGMGGQIRIHMRSARRLDTGESGVRVVIGDTGTGIPAHLLPRVCEPFVSTKDATGTGLGMWVTKGIMQRHNGRIKIRSRTDARYHGTVVSLFFPYAGVEE